MSKTESVTNSEDLELVAAGIKEEFHQILKMNIAEWNLNREETIKQEKIRAKLRIALKNCSYGDTKAKIFIVEYIKDLLQKKFKVDPEKIDSLIPFGKPDDLNIQDKFDVILYLYKKEFGGHGLERLIKDHNLDEIKYKDSKPCYEIGERDVESIFWMELRELTYEEKLDILTQRIYQIYKGHGVIDGILDMFVDGVSSGVSFDILSIWIFFQGKTIHLPFLRFSDEKELARICKNIYRYGNPGQLSASRGYMANERKDGSRVVVVRPPFAESWAFFVRKFDTIKKNSLEDLLTDENSQVVIENMQWLMKGCQVIGITGAQGCGKTTLLMSLIQFINPAYTLRVQELTFELHLRKLYPERNILTFKETSTVSGQEGLDLLKKTDGTVTILGEVATASVASWLVELAQVASLFTVFTHHAKTTKDLIIALRNSLLQVGGFSNEMVAREQVVETIRFDIHMDKDIAGHRFVERITEIIPDKSDGFRTVDLVVLESGRYKQKNLPSQNVQNEVLKHLSIQDRLLFLKYLDGGENVKSE